MLDDIHTPSKLARQKMISILRNFIRLLCIFENMQQLTLQKVTTNDNAEYHRVYLSTYDFTKLYNKIIQNKTFDIPKNDPLFENVDIVSITKYIILKGQILEFTKDPLLSNGCMAVNAFLRNLLGLEIGKPYDLELAHWGLVDKY